MVCGGGAGSGSVVLMDDHILAGISKENRVGEKTKSHTGWLLS